MNRSWIFVPGDSEKMLGKAAGLDADAVIYDLEDAVTGPRKALARGRVLAQLCNPVQPRGERWVRINALDTGLAADDLDGVMAGTPDGIWLPKAEHASQANWLADELSAREARLGIAAGTTRIALIAFESAAGVLNAASFQELDDRVCALSWGGEDLAADIGASASRHEDGRYRFGQQMARSLTLIAAGAAGVQAVDTVFTDFRDTEGHAASCAESRIDGFCGKMAIHPAQLPAINQSFTPSEVEIVEARAVAEAFAAQPEAGSIALDGKMLDRPHLRRAQRVLALARRG